MYEREREREGGRENHTYGCRIRQTHCAPVYIHLHTERERYT